MASVVACDALAAECRRDATGERSVSLAKMVLSDNTHLAARAREAPV